MSSEASEPRAVGQVGVLAIVDFAESARWAWARSLMFGRWPLAKTEGIRFGKVLGSGHDGGFGLRPSFTHQGLFCTFDDDATADAFLASSKHVALFKSHGVEWATMKVRAYASRGLWSGVAPLACTVDRPSAGPVASLTRGSIRPSKAKRFWSFSPPAQAAIAAHPGCLLAVGLGEAPVFRQCTFTLWRDEAALTDFGRHSAHHVAAQAAMTEGHFSESLFARWVAYGAQGSWKGVDAASWGLPAR